MSEHIRKKHNVNLILYHIVCPCKYRRKVITKEVSETLKKVCIGISKRYEIQFLEIGTDEDHVHFLIQTAPILSPKQVVQTIKSITARHIFTQHPEIKKFLWGGKLWTCGYYVNTVGQYGNEQIIKNYVKSQGKKYEEVYKEQLALSENIN